MTFRLIRLFRLEKLPDKPPAAPDGYGLYAPVGFEVLQAFMASDGLAVSGFCSPNGLKVWHPFVALRNDQPYEQPNGRGLRFLAVIPMGTDLIHIFADTPWPTFDEALAIAQTEGQA